MNKAYRYKYHGKEEIHISYVGTFQPGEERSTTEPIDHPDFELIEGNEEKDTKSVKNKKQ